MSGADVRVSVVITAGRAHGHGVAAALAALLGDPGQDFEIILVEDDVDAGHAVRWLADARLRRFGSVGLSAAEARTLGGAAAAARFVVHLDLCEWPAGPHEPLDAIRVALLVRPALELLRVARTGGERP